MNAKHTTGTWIHKPDAEGFMTIESSNGRIIVGGCGCCQSPYGGSESRGHTYYNPDEEDKANAALICAAPDNLALLKRLYDEDLVKDRGVWLEIRAALLKSYGVTGDQLFS